ncbi:hypothetical protein PsAD13_01413 [Pseudovibrio sp. Ad13]|nr:hypothetical protein PsAD13_01413 [Pseudovibrio sp. Ad13]
MALDYDLDKSWLAVSDADCFLVYVGRWGKKYDRHIVVSYCVIIFASGYHLSLQAFQEKVARLVFFYPLLCACRCVCT